MNIQVAKGAAAAGVVSVLVASPAHAGDAEAGEQLFNVLCLSCHNRGRNIIIPEKTLEKEALDQYLAGGRSEESVITQVTNGKAAMPAFGKRLPDSDIADIAAYVIEKSEAGWD